MIDIENETINDHNGVTYNISWDPPSCEVDFYTLYFTTQDISECQNETIRRDVTHYHYKSFGLKEMQIAAHLNDMTNCTEGMLSCNKSKYY